MQSKNELAVCFILIVICTCKAFPTQKPTGTFTAFSIEQNVMKNMGIEHPLASLRVVSYAEDKPITNSASGRGKKKSATVGVHPLLLEKNEQEFTI